MSLFSKVLMACNTCSRYFYTDFQRYGGRFCCQECHQEYELRRATAIMGVDDKEKCKPYIPSDKLKEEIHD